MSAQLGRHGYKPGSGKSPLKNELDHNFCMMTHVRIFYRDSVGQFFDAGYTVLCLPTQGLWKFFVQTITSALESALVSNDLDMHYSARDKNASFSLLHAMVCWPPSAHTWPDMLLKESNWDRVMLLVKERASEDTLLVDVELKWMGKAETLSTIPE
ncbi:hypothetical protein MMC06_006697 [Schaereria dolodes]|nr:hypothetical protein [Schaereria dolodes]